LFPTVIITTAPTIAKIARPAVLAAKSPGLCVTTVSVVP
jgi:hypothetical protein